MQNKNKANPVNAVSIPCGLNFFAFHAIMENKHVKVTKMLKAIGIELKGEEKELEGKNLLKLVMHKWLPAGDTLLEMIVLHLPSPAVAQTYPIQDTACVALRSQSC